MRIHGQEFRDLRPPTRHHRLRHRPAPATAPGRPAQRRPHRRRPAAARTFAGHHSRPQWKTDKHRGLARTARPARCGSIRIRSRRRRHLPRSRPAGRLSHLRSAGNRHAGRQAQDSGRRRLCAPPGRSPDPHLRRLQHSRQADLRPHRRLDTPPNPVIPSGVEGRCARAARRKSPPSVSTSPAP